MNIGVYEIDKFQHWLTDLDEHITLVCLRPSFICMLSTPNRGVGVGVTEEVEKIDHLIVGDNDLVRKTFFVSLGGTRKDLYIALNSFKAK